MAQSVNTIKGKWEASWKSFRHRLGQRVVYVIFRKAVRENHTKDCCTINPSFPQHSNQLNHFSGYSTRILWCTYISRRMCSELIAFPQAPSERMYRLGMQSCQRDVMWTAIALVSYNNILNGRCHLDKYCTQSSTMMKPKKVFVVVRSENDF